MRTMTLLLMVVALSSYASAGQVEGRAPDGTPLACNFHFRLEVRAGLQVATDPLMVSTDCDGYHIRLDKNPGDPSQGTFSISLTGEQASTYHLTDMPLEEPLLLLDPDRTATRIVARRRLDRIDCLVGTAAFRSVPPRSLMPRTPVASPRSADKGPVTRDLLLGNWRSQGMSLVIRPNGRFDKISTVSYGSFGFNDSGSYEVRGSTVVFRGLIREWSCDLAAARLTCDGVSYRRD